MAYVSYGTAHITRYVEVVAGDECSRDVGFLFNLDCTCPGEAADHIDPGHAPEFELDRVGIEMDGGGYFPITLELLDTLVGKDEAQKLLDNAIQEAIESEDF